jgi:hypothetical protein
LNNMGEDMEEVKAGKRAGIPPTSSTGGRGMEAPVPGEFVDTDDVKEQIARACGDLPLGEQGMRYAERVAAAADDRADISRLYSGDPQDS